MRLLKTLLILVISLATVSLAFAENISPLAGESCYSTNKTGNTFQSQSVKFTPVKAFPAPENLISPFNQKALFASGLNLRILPQPGSLFNNFDFNRDRLRNNFTFKIINRFERLKLASLPFNRYLNSNNSRVNQFSFGLFPGCLQYGPRRFI